MKNIPSLKGLKEIKPVHLKTGMVIEVHEDVRGLVLSETAVSNTPVVLYEDGQWDCVVNMIGNIDRVYAPSEVYDLNPIHMKNNDYEPFLIWSKPSSLQVECGDFVKSLCGNYVYVVSNSNPHEKTGEAQYNLISLIDGCRKYRWPYNKQVLQTIMKGYFEIITKEEMLDLMKKTIK